jgi:organic radical activating enzyme
MRKHSELLNVCLVTNRGCNLRCEHCYIEPELLASKSFISDETFRLVYKRSLELIDLDKRTYRVNVESLGGEPTFIPVEFWERNLPFAMEMAEKFKKKTDKKAAFAFCSNMIIADKRYYDLFKNYSKNKNFELFIPWEPDTKRFGTRNKLYKKYEKSLEELKDCSKTLSLIPTKALIDLGVEYIINEHVLKHHFNDISTDMLYQFGSGKEFFEKNMPLFSEVSQWYIDIVEATPKGVTISPYEEVLQSLTLGVPYHCMGNDHYDVEIEPDGSTSLNSSMTGSEAQMPTRPLSVMDDKWAIKLMFENTVDLDLKLNHTYDFCRQCEYQRFCLGGYYHYKLLDKQAIKVLTEDGQGDCPGYRKFWDHVATKHQNDILPIYELNHKNLVDRLRRGRHFKAPEHVEFVSEADLSKDGYEKYFERVLDVKGILIDRKMFFSKTISQRVWFYDSLGIQVEIVDDLWLAESSSVLVENTVYGNYICVKFSDERVLEWCERFRNVDISEDIFAAIGVVKNYSNFPTVYSDSPTIIGNGLYVDARNTELFQWADSIEVDPSDHLMNCEISSYSLNAIENILDFGKRNRSVIRIYGA